MSAPGPGPTHAKLLQDLTRNLVGMIPSIATQRRTSSRKLGAGKLHAQFESCGRAGVRFWAATAKVGGMTPVRIILIAFGCLALALAAISVITIIRKDAPIPAAYVPPVPPPTCETDWRLCSDNEQLMSKWRGLSGAQRACKEEANKLVRFGEPKWPFYYFQTYYPGGPSYVSTGKLIIVEKGAQFQNGFGAMEHVTLGCTFDLNRGVVDRVLSYPG
jgi:hypothetical protein